MQHDPPNWIEIMNSVIVTITSYQSMCPEWPYHSKAIISEANRRGCRSKLLAFAMMLVEPDAQRQEGSEVLQDEYRRLFDEHVAESVAKLG